jgi:hypothetical protein
MSARWTDLLCRKRARTRHFPRPLAELIEPRILLSAIPAPLARADIGAHPHGSSSFTAGTFTVTGAGAGFTGVSDAGGIVYEPLSGDGTVTVRLLGSSAARKGALAGLDIRSSLAPTASNLFLGTQADGSFLVNERPADLLRGIAIKPGVSATTPEFLQIARTGNNVQASVSADGIHFTLLFASSIDLPETALVGMAVSSSKAVHLLATATFDNFSVTPIPPPLASVTSAPTIGGASTNPYRFTVTYSEPFFLVDTTTLSDSNVTVIGPDGVI